MRHDPPVRSREVAAMDRSLSCSQPTDMVEWLTFISGIRPAAGAVRRGQFDRNRRPGHLHVRYASPTEVLYYAVRTGPVHDSLCLVDTNTD